jgi:hypothetical protein
VNKRPFSVKLTLVLIVLNSLIWFALGIIIVLNVHPALPDSPTMKGIMAFLSIAMAVILIVLFVLLQKGNRSAYYLLVAFFGFVSILTIFDDVGLSDVIVLSLNIIPIVLLIKDHKWYRPSPSKANVID